MQRCNDDVLTANIYNIDRRVCTYSMDGRNHDCEHAHDEIHRASQHREKLRGTDDKNDMDEDMMTLA